MASSSEVLPHSLDLFGVEPTLLAVEKFYFERIPTKTQLNDPNLSQFEISAPASREVLMISVVVLFC